MANVEVRKLRVTYDAVQAVKDVSFDLEPGKIYGFVGPNGSGKTSTIKAIAGVLEPAEGSIVINGHDLFHEREKALTKVGYMPDSAPVYPNLKVWEYLDLFAAAYGMSQNERKDHVEEWMHKVDLYAKRNDLIKGLSHGMKQRLVLAKTLLSNPNVLLLDEPANGLDPIARLEMRDLMKMASQQGASILVSSHILTELSEFIDSVIIVEKGTLVAAGSLDDVRNQVGVSQRLYLVFANPASEGIFNDYVTRQAVLASGIKRVKQGYELTHFGHDGDGAVFLKNLMNAGVVLKECVLRPDDVEDIFLKIGAKEVA